MTPTLSQGQAEPTPERIRELAHRHAWRYKKSSDPDHSDTYTFNGCALENFARAVEREALAASSAAPTADPWRPIETLPTDGKRVFLWCTESGDDRRGGIVFGHRYESGNVRGEGMTGSWEFSHWMPIPAGPGHAAAQLAAAAAPPVACPRGHNWHDYGQLAGRNVSWCPRCDTLAFTGQEPGAAVAAPEARIEGQMLAALHAANDELSNCTDADARRVAAQVRAAIEAAQGVAHPAAPGSSMPPAAPLSEPCALDQGARPVWQLIETAPKGTRAPLLGMVDGDVRLIRWGKTSHVPLYGWCLADQGAEDFDLCKPTHWMPLPDAPADIAPPVDLRENSDLSTDVLRGSRDLSTAAPQAAPSVAAPDAWQLETSKGWIALEAEDVEYYRQQGRKVRPLYAALPLPAVVQAAPGDVHPAAPQTTVPTAAPFSEPRALGQGELPVRLMEVLTFLHGAGPLEGVWFGEDHPTETGRFWWRSRLRAAMSAPGGGGAAA